MGDNEIFSSEKEAPLVAEADKAVNSIATSDVLTEEEKMYLEQETKANAQFFNLQKDSELTDLPPSFLAELASTGSCSNEMNNLDQCLRAQSDSESGK